VGHELLKGLFVFLLNQQMNDALSFTQHGTVSSIFVKKGKDVVFLLNGCEGKWSVSANTSVIYLRGHFFVGFFLHDFDDGFCIG
jgi:hypothetical protein